MCSTDRAEDIAGQTGRSISLSTRRCYFGIRRYTCQEPLHLQLVDRWTEPDALLHEIRFGDLCIFESRSRLGRWRIEFYHHQAGRLSAIHHGEDCRNVHLAFTQRAIPEIVWPPNSLSGACAAPGEENPSPPELGSDPPFLQLPDVRSELHHTRVDRFQDSIGLFARFHAGARVLMENRR